MNQDDEIRSLQEELHRLQEQTKLQYQQITEMQRRLQHLLPQQQNVVTSTGKGTNFSLENFIGLRLIHFIGIVALVIGLSIGVKYAIDRNLVSETLRIAMAYLAGGILFFLSIRLKKKYELFSAILFSGGMASLYFTTYAAFVYYSMMPFGLAFGIMAVLTFYTVYQAIAYNRELIAILGLIGAYAIPFLISPNTGNPNLFFLYISLINGALIYLCLRQKWVQTILVALFVTWLLYFGWSVSKLNVEWLFTGWAFLITFFLLFYIYALLNKDWSDGFEGRKLYIILLSNGAFYFGGLLLLTRSGNSISFGLFTLFISIFLFIQAALFRYIWYEQLLRKRLMSLAFIFFVLFIAMEWSGMTLTLLWLLTAVVTFSVGIWFKKASFRIAAIVLMATTLGKLVLLDSLSFSAIQKVVAYVLLGVLLLVISFYYQKFKQKIFGEK